ncbi:hypothetical protein [Microbulbifer sp. TYP-18]|uniref:hypothetical protein n=1 Tax=Microbulbifer sp. TYP-18 TaxID=3230024 RepID=UPI0034C66E7D
MSNWVARSLLLSGLTLVLAACSADRSDELAQEEPLDVALAQCEVVHGGMVGTPLEPVLVDGVMTQACLLSTELSRLTRVKLKNSHNYAPLVWVLDGVYEVGTSKPYRTLAELQGDDLHELEMPQTKDKLYARAGSLVVVHRNGLLRANIVSIDDDNIGGGEWGGLVVNGIGYHPDCGSGVSADNFCNVEGDWGFFGGLSLQESREADILLKDSSAFSNPSVTGFTGWIAEAGGETIQGPQLEAAITVNAPHLGQNPAPSGVFYSGRGGLQLRGGAMEIGTYAMGNRGHAIHWLGGFGGFVRNSLIYHQAETAALRGENSAAAVGESEGQEGVVLDRLVLVDKALTGGGAIEFSGGGSVSMNNVAVQGFGHCLKVDDASTQLKTTNSVFYCASPTEESGGGVDFADQVLASGTNVYQLNPDLTPTLGFGNPAIIGVASIVLNTALEFQSGYELGLYYAPCYGVGTQTGDTLNIGTSSYSVCELSGRVNDNFYFDDDINDELVAWRIVGRLTFGSDFGLLDQQQQQAALMQPQQVVLDGNSKLLLGEQSSLAFSPDVVLRVQGTPESPVQLEPQEHRGSWGGVAIQGLAQNCSGQDLCRLAREQFVDISYLRLLGVGGDQPALAMREVSEAGQVDYLDISDSDSDGLELIGGVVNIKHLLVSNVAGNQVQWSDGYRGSLQYAILNTGERGRGHALLGRNDATDHDANPRSRPVLANVTIKGAEAAASAILLEQGSGLLLYNSVVTDFSNCLDIDDLSTNNLQYSDPLQIYFDNVVLDCDATVTSDEESSTGGDFAEKTRDLSGVYQVSAVLDSSFVPSGAGIPGISSPIDFTLAGSTAAYLDKSPLYMGAVVDSRDDWYLGWSDSVGVLLAEECDFKGVLEDDYVYRNRTVPGVTVGNQTYFSKYKVCGLRGTITEDFLLTAYTGVDAEAIASGSKVVEELYPGYTVERDPALTLWLLNGLVRIGEGHFPLTESAQVEAMKANPVTLGIEASTIIMASEGAGLHITRGGALVIMGDRSLANPEDDDAAGPVNLVGQLVSNQPIFDTGEPLRLDVANWVGLIVDGFARNNQCPDATTGPANGVCNIEGEFGFYGGYDDAHNNLWIENLHMQRGSLRLNSVGQGGRLENFYFSLGRTVRLGLDAWGADNNGRAAIDIQGGSVNLRNVNIAKVGAGSAIRWNHGYRGSMQTVHINGLPLVGAFSSTDPSFFDTLYRDESGNWQYYPVIRGSNGEVGSEDALPRSAPTLANLTLYAADGRDFNSSRPEVESTAIELSRGSGLYLYNSIVGSAKADDSPFFGNTIADRCIRADSTVLPLLGEAIVFDQVAFGCKSLSGNTAVNRAINSAFVAKTLANVPGTVSNRSTIANPSLADAEIYNFDWVVGRGKLNDHNSIDQLEVFKQWEGLPYPSPDLINLGKAVMQVSGSQDQGNQFFVNSDYFGALDYFIVTDSGGEIRAD